jgi:hypothetical protein
MIKESVSLVFKSSLKITLFVLLCFVITELTYRFYLLGPVTFRPVLFNSVNMLLRSGLIEQSEHSDIGYQLKPDLDTWFQALPFATNSYGLADHEYELAKGANKYRVAVVGSSWSMATGVDQTDTYHALLEESLNEAGGPVEYEFLNFATENYGLREIVGTARERAPAWDPDVYLVGITTYTARMEWRDDAEPFSVPAQTYPFFQSYVLRALGAAVGLTSAADDGIKIPVLDTEAYSDGRYFAQIERAIDEVHAVAASGDAKVVVLWLSYATPGPEIEEIMRLKAEKLGIVFVRGYDALWDPEQHERFKRWRVDEHPNAEGHAAIADLLRREMIASGLLPAGNKISNMNPAG